MHVRRTVVNSTSSLEVSESNVVYVTQNQFLSNTNNKNNFLELIGTILKKPNLSVLQARNDTYVSIGEVAKKNAKSRKYRAVFAID